MAFSGHACEQRGRVWYDAGARVLISGEMHLKLCDNTCNIFPIIQALDHDRVTRIFI